MVYPNVTDPVSVPNGTPNGTLFVCVADTYGKGKVDALTKQLVSLEDCSRGYWTAQNISAAHGDDCDWLMAHMNGRIVGVWQINQAKGWMDPRVTPKRTWPSDKAIPPPTRKGCELNSVNESFWNKFVGQEVHLGRCKSPLRGYFV